MLFLYLIGPILQAQNLDQIRAHLKTLTGKAPLVLKAERQSWNRELKEGVVAEQGWVRAHLEASGAGMRVLPGTESASTPVKPGEPPRPLGDREATEILGAAEALLKTLAEGRFQSETAESRNGQPTRHLHFTLPLEDEAEARKHLKEAWRTFDLWVRPDGTPMATYEAFQIRGRVLFVRIEAGAQIRREYQMVGDRLVMVQENKEAHGSGMGQGSEGRSTLTVSPL